MAGGVAHDLNNLLVPIIGYTELLDNDDELSENQHNAVSQILNAGLRSKDLIQQLLAFSRKQTLKFVKIDVNSIFNDFSRLLRRTIKEHIEINYQLLPEPLYIMADVGQIEQVIMNIIVNAADAMPKGGEITIKTALGGENLNQALIFISDTGIGMEDFISSKIFEPFYTTKGEFGTGLGLSTAYGIILQHKGKIEVQSQINQGTTFKISLPLSDSDSAVNDPIFVESDQETMLGLPKGNETILIVEDNLQVLNFTRLILSKCGYKVLFAKNGKQALKIIQDLDEKIDLLLTDIIMPQMNGRELYVLAVEIQPELKVLFMSGYNDNIISFTKGPVPPADFIQKPFKAVELSQKIRNVLGNKNSDN